MPVFNFNKKKNKPKETLENLREIEESLLMKKIAEEQYMRVKKTLRDWDYAISCAKSKEFLNKSPLMDIYEQVVDDATVYGAMRLRIESVIQSSLEIWKGDNLTEEYDKFFRTPAFFTLMNGFLEAKFFGSTTMEILGQDRNGGIGKVEIIPRKNDLPEFNKIKFAVYDSDSTYGYSGMKNVIQVYKCPLGLLNKIVPLWIYKKEAMKAYALFSEKFGIPIRVGKTPSNDPKYKRELMEFLKNIGASSSAVIGIEDQIEFISTSSSDAYQVYVRLIELINNEIKKAILGNTMMMDDGSSYSQAQVHENAFNYIKNADVRDLEWFMNIKLIPKLKQLGYINENEDIELRLDTSERLQLKDRMDMDKHLISQGYKIDIDYLNNTYHTQLLVEEEKKDVGKEKPKQTEPIEEVDENSKPKKEIEKDDLDADAETDE